VPDRFLVGLAALNLFANVAEEQPLVCVVDDAQWLDPVSAQLVAFVGRRLLAERIAMIAAVREPSDEAEFAAWSELAVRGLPVAAAGEILDSMTGGPVDPRIRERILAETRGNPLALIELPRAWTTAELADVLGDPDGVTLSGRMEEGFRRRLE